MASKPYNGHPSWTAWNVSLWISNDEGLYRLGLDCLASHKTLDRAALAFMDQVGTGRTPDGAVYSRSNVRYALAGLRD